MRFIRHIQANERLGDTLRSAATVHSRSVTIGHAGTLPCATLIRNRVVPCPAYGPHAGRFPAPDG